MLEVMRNINVGARRLRRGGGSARLGAGADALVRGASPSAHVTEDAFERIVRTIGRRHRDAAGPLDAVYLDLHGAMVAEHLDDGEGEMLARVRQLIGHDMPLVASLDLHANVTPRDGRAADALIAYRTYPHVDMADTGRAAREHLALLLDDEAEIRQGLPAAAVPDPDHLAMHRDGADQEHLRRSSRRCEGDARADALLPAGLSGGRFPRLRAERVRLWRDAGRCGPAADAIAALVDGHEDDFDGTIYTPDEGVRMRWRLAKTATKPVVIADTQDNPGAGGDSDTTGMLRALVRNDAQRAAIGVIVDPAAAAAAHAAGVGATVTLSLGGKSGIPGDAPSRTTFVVEQLSDGEFIAPGPYYGGRADGAWGRRPACGSAACASSSSSRKAQLADQAMYRYVGIEPTEQAILVNKSSVHFRADFEPIAETIIDLRRARRDAGRHRRPAVDAAASGHPHQAERHGHSSSATSSRSNSARAKG